MAALAAGTGGVVCIGNPPKDAAEIAVWGHLWLGEKLIPKAHAKGLPWWFIDNGWWKPARGQPEGYYSLTYRSLGPVLLDQPDMTRLPVQMEPWRTNRDGYVLIAMPGMQYGRMLGFNMPAWAATIRQEVAKHTARPIRVREKGNPRNLDEGLAEDLAGAFVVVTHSSKVAVDAVLAGVPAIVAPTNPAAPVCSTDLADIENPPMPDRAKWWASLMCQQFTIPEMRDGTAKFWMERVREHGLYGPALQPEL